MNRALILHMSLFVYRIIYIIANRDDYLWHKYEPQADDQSLEVSEQHEHAFKVCRVAWYVLLIIGFILDLCCLKWRKIAKLFFPHEAILLLLTSVIPIKLCSLEQYTYVFYFFLMTCIYFCDVRIGLITVVLSSIALPIIRSNFMVFEQEEEISYQIKRFLLLIVLINCIIMILASLVTYLSQLQTRIRQQMVEYFNLINRMREGVLVLYRD